MVLTIFVWSGIDLIDFEIFLKFCEDLRLVKFSRFRIQKSWAKVLAYVEKKGGHQIVEFFLIFTVVFIAGFLPQSDATRTWLRDVSKGGHEREVLVLMWRLRAREGRAKVTTGFLRNFATLVASQILGGGRSDDWQPISADFFLH